VSEEAIALLSRLPTLQLQVAQSQPAAAPATLKLLEQAIQRTLVRIPALERSIQEVKMEWNFQFSMTLQPRISDSATSKRLLDNLRRSRLELAESNLELAETILNGSEFHKNAIAQGCHRVRDEIVEPNQIGGKDDRPIPKTRSQTTAF
jgi:hypothetical protein